MLEQEVQILRLKAEKVELTKEEHKRFWRLVEEAKIEYDCVPEPIAKDLGYIRRETVTIERFDLQKALLLFYFIPFVFCLILLIAWISRGRFSGSYDSWQVVLWFLAYFTLADRSHTLTHYIVGKLTGIKFTSMLAKRGFPLILELDYETYLKAGFRKRKILHISGTVASILILFIWVTTTDAWFWFVPLLFYLIAFTFALQTGYAKDISFYKREKKLQRQHNLIIKRN